MSWRMCQCHAGGSGSFRQVPLQQQYPATFQGEGGGGGLGPPPELDLQQQPCDVVISPVFSQDEIDMLLEVPPPPPSSL